MILQYGSTPAQIQAGKDAFIISEHLDILSEILTIIQSLKLYFLASPSFMTSDN